MAEPNIKDWVLPMDFEIDDNLELDKLEKVVKAGYQIEVNDGKKAKVVGRVIIKGDINKDSLDVTK